MPFPRPSLASPITRRQLIGGLAAGAALSLMPRLGWGADPSAGGGSLQWCWSGGISDGAASVVGCLPGIERVALEIRDAGGQRRVQALAPQPTEHGIVRFALSGLQADTVYSYFFHDGRQAVAGGLFRTFPLVGQPANFRIACASCNRQGNNPVFQAIAHQNPLFFLHMGDLHYRDIRQNEPQRYRDAYAAVVGDPAQMRLYRSRGIAYMWDDHDYGPNDSGHDSPSREAAHTAYRQCAPHYPLEIPAESPERAAPIGQAFSVGRVRFILTDLRSEHSHQAGAHMGELQKKWFFTQLLEARQNHGLVVWMSSIPYISSRGRDNWNGGAVERREIANFIKRHEIPICILAGDAHMVAIDDGSNADYADGGGAPIPVFQAASLGAGPSFKGGPYNIGARPGRQQFGIMDVEDDGQTIRVSWSARDGSDGIGDAVVTDRDNDTPIQHQFIIG